MVNDDDTNETKNSGTTVVVVLILLLFFAAAGSWLYITSKKKQYVSTPSQYENYRYYQNTGKGNDDNFLADNKGKTVPATKLLTTSVKPKIIVDNSYVNKIQTSDIYYDRNNPFLHPDAQQGVKYRQQLINKRK